MSRIIKKMLDIQNIRREYKLKSFDIEDLSGCPFIQFSNWYQEAKEAHIEEPNAMALATSTLNGTPSCRFVLLKHMDEKGFTFFTNYQSRKGGELSSNPQACATFYWAPLERQVIIRGLVEKLSREESAKYFENRPRGSQIGAWASPQSQIVSSKELLLDNFNKYEKMYEGKQIPLPPFWGGYCLIPDAFEFWQGRPNRLHDRFLYRRENDTWIIDRLAP